MRPETASMLDSRIRGKDRDGRVRDLIPQPVIPAKAGIQSRRHKTQAVRSGAASMLDSRIRGKDRDGRVRDLIPQSVIPAKAGIQS